MQAMVNRHRNKKVGSILIAPCGKGDDLPDPDSLATRIYGLDVSPVALAAYPIELGIVDGDIGHLPYQSEPFDLVAAPLFFHNMVNYGSSPFLQEFYRVPKSGGGIVLLKPSICYPPNILTWPTTSLFPNPYEEVEDKDLYHLNILESPMERAGFIDLDIQAATFSHCAFYVSVAKTINRLTGKFLRT